MAEVLARGPHPPLRIDFTAPTTLFREQHRPSMLRICGNGPPGTFVLFENGLRVSLPTDQIVFADDTAGHRTHRCTDIRGVAPPLDNTVVPFPLLAGIADIVGIMLLPPAMRWRMGRRIGQDRTGEQSGEDKERRTS